MASKALGRAMPPRFIMTPLITRRMDNGAQRHPGGYSDAARLWANLRALAARIRRALAAHDWDTLDRCRLKAVCMATERVRHASSCWRQVHDAADEAAGRMAIYRMCEPRAQAVDVEAAAATFERLEKEEVSRTRAAANVQWHAWVARAIAGGARAAHRWTNAPNAAVTEVVAPGTTNPLEIVQHHAGAWGGAWKVADAEAVHEAMASAAEARRIALCDPRHGKCVRRVDGQMVKEVANSVRRGTAIGLDAQGFKEVADATEEAREELAAIVRESVECLAWPVQVLTVLMALLGKKAGGSRAIAIMATFARLLLALTKGEVREWDEAVGDGNDTALNGRRPLDETAGRHLRLELASLQGRHAITLLWDMEKFFDSLDARILVNSVVDADFSADQHAMWLMMHRAPRVLRVQGCHAEPVERTGRSVLPGCTLSTSFARAYLKPLREACGSSTACTVTQHVDDLTQSVVAATRQLAIARAISHGCKLAEEASKLGLSLAAGKSKVVASSPAAARDVAAGLAKRRVSIGAARAAEDLGVSTAGGARRTVGSFAKRLVRAAKRASRVAQLVKANGGAKKLLKSGVAPQQSYEDCVHGASPPQVKAMRRNACMCVKPAGAQPCSASLLAWRIEGADDPAVSAPRRQIQLWRRIWSTTKGGERAAVRKAWRTAHPKILLGKVNWGAASGPMQATIATLGQLGWSPVSPSRWLSPDKSTHADLEDDDPQAAWQIEQAVERSARRAVWKAAAAHHLGAGLEEGIPSFEPAKQARKWLTRRGRTAEAKALDVVVCGGSWHGGRAQLRRRCKCGQIETPFHRYWTCPRLRGIAEEDGGDIIAATQWLAREFEGSVCDYGDAAYYRSHCATRVRHPPLMTHSCKRRATPRKSSVALEPPTPMDRGAPNTPRKEPRLRAADWPFSNGTSAMEAGRVSTTWDWWRPRFLDSRRCLGPNSGHSALRTRVRPWADGWSSRLTPGTSRTRWSAKIGVSGPSPNPTGICGPTTTALPLTGASRCSPSR